MKVSKTSQITVFTWHGGAWGVFLYLVLDNVLLIVTFPSENKSGSICGTPNYIAPEVLHKMGHSTASEVILLLLIPMV